MSTNAVYENFRTVLTMNLCTVVSDSVVLNDVLRMVDISMNDFDISKKSLEIIPVNDMTPIIKCYLASKSIANLSKGTVKQYKYKLVDFFSSVGKSYIDITTNDIRIYLYNFKISRNASDSYVDNVRITLNSFFSWLVENEYLQRNPCSKVDKIKYQQKRREPLTPYQLEKIRWDAKDVREKALIDIFYSTGCRVSECADIRLSDINWEQRSIHIRHGKGDKERTVFFNAEAEVAMKAYLNTRSDNTDALFVSTKSPHQPLQSHALENIIKKVSKCAGIHVYPHKLRHTFATASLHGGMSLEKLQALMGHSKPETTLIYAKQDQKDLQIEHQRIYA